MKITKWKSISQWKPATFTLSDMVDWISTHGWLLPKDIQEKIVFTVPVTTTDLLLRKITREVFLPRNQIYGNEILKATINQDRNPFLKSYAQEVLVKIGLAIAQSKDNPIAITSLQPYFVLIYAIDRPQISGKDTTKTLTWLFKDDLYIYDYSSGGGEYSLEQVQLLILEFYDKDRQKWESLKRKYKSDRVEQESHHRERIPEDVRIAVWRRDGGMCARPGCGSRENLEYDHIIPLSKGGSNTARNIELLCEKHNREKSNNIE